MEVLTFRGRAFEPKYTLELASASTDASPLSNYPFLLLCNRFPSYCFDLQRFLFSIIFAVDSVVVVVVIVAFVKVVVVIVAVVILLPLLLLFSCCHCSMT